jgi:hypothetical protein
MGVSKECKKCGIIKQLDDFYPQERGLFGRTSRCIECERKRGKEYRAAIRAPKEIFPQNIKRCSKCKEILSLENFHTDNEAKDKLTSQCKLCRNHNTKKWRIENTEHVKNTNAAWRSKNKEHLKEYSKKWFESNPDYRPEYIKENYDYHRQSCKKWRIKNRDKIKEKMRYKSKYDISFILRSRLRRRLRSALKNNHKVGSAVRDLGCSIENLKSYIEQKFYPHLETGEQMTWDNYGKWHIDHIRPLASFDLSDRCQFLEACHYTNLQPLWAEDNLKKGAKIENNL